MTWGDALENVNYVVALVAALVTFGFGFIWYHEAVFGKEWQKLVGLKKKDMENKAGMPTMFAAMFVFSFLAAATLSALMSLTGFEGGGDGALLGAIIGLIFSFGPIASNYAFARRKIELTLLDGGYYILQFALLGWIVGFWV